jgi:catechol 2,3-dioxygenase-like lactoylglutathione lyase family enzyme
MAEAVLGDVRIVTLRVANWAEQVRWYADVLGLRQKFADLANEYAMFEAGPIRIAIEGPLRPAHRREGHAGAAMLNFEVADLQAAVRQLAAAGAASMTGVRHGRGYDYVAVGDPEGNEHIVFQRQAPAA